MKIADDYQVFASPRDPGDWKIACWEIYDPSSKVDLHATAVALADGRLLFVDPVPLANAALEQMLDELGAKPSGVLVTNGNHARAAAAFRQRCGGPLCAMEAAARDAGLALDVAIPAAGGSVLAGACEAVPLPGAAAGETAFYFAGGGGLIVLGDALINLPSHPFMILPKKYCENAKTLRRSLTALLEKEFCTLAFAHGQPLTVNPRARLAALLD